MAYVNRFKMKLGRETISELHETDAYSPETIREATKGGVFITGGGGTMMAHYLREIGEAWDQEVDRPEIVIHYNSSNPDIIEEFPWFKAVQIDFLATDGIPKQNVLKEDGLPFGIYVFGAAGGYGDLGLANSVDTTPHKSIMDIISSASGADYTPHIIFSNSYPGNHTWTQMEQKRVEMVRKYGEQHPKSLKVISNFLETYNSTVAVAKWHTANYAMKVATETGLIKFTNLVIPLIFERRRPKDRKQPMAQYIAAMIRGRRGTLDPFSEEGFEVMEILGGIITNSEAAQSLMYATITPNADMHRTLERDGMIYEHFAQEYPDI